MFPKASDNFSQSLNIHFYRSWFQYLKQLTKLFDIKFSALTILSLLERLSIYEKGDNKCYDMQKDKKEGHTHPQMF